MKRKNKPDAEGQLEAAHIIAALPEKYPGLPQLWAKLILERHAPPELNMVARIMTNVGCVK